MKNKPLILIILSLALLAFGSCATYIPLNKDIRNNVGDQIEFLQLYIDRSLTLERVVSASDPQSLESGKYTTRKGISYHTVVFKKKLAGVAKDISSIDTIFVMFDDKDDSEYLTFKIADKGSYYYLVLNKSNLNGTVTYGDYDYTVIKETDIRLLIRRRDEIVKTRSKHKATGRKINETYE
jgi:hypothetical protein